MPHKHADAMFEYSLDALETNKPWERWEATSSHSPNWDDLNSSPSWSEHGDYRRKVDAPPLPIDSTKDLYVPDNADPVQVIKRVITELHEQGHHVTEIDILWHYYLNGDCSLVNVDVTLRG